MPKTLPQSFNCHRLIGGQDQLQYGCWRVVKRPVEQRKGTEPMIVEPCLLGILKSCQCILIRLVGEEIRPCSRVVPPNLMIHGREARILNKTQPFV